MTDNLEVSRILNANNLYDVLAVQKDCSADDLKRSYRKIAAKVHPDRCKDPKATEAFQKVSHAYQTLSDSEKRRRYDLLGDVENNNENFYQNPGSNYRHRTYTYATDEISPEDLFGMFFGSPFFYAQRPHQRPRPAYQQRQPQANRINKCSMFLPLISIGVLLLPNLLGSIFSQFSSLQGIEDNIVFLRSSRNDNNDYIYIGQTRKYRAYVSAKRSWLNTQAGTSFSVQSKVKEILDRADKLYPDYLRAKCAVDQNNEVRSSYYCREMQNKRIQPTA